ncbi:MAG TPA: PAS domain S-box protein [bacterium]|nr:PAS domain S-box protein [bacterium]
MNFITVRERLTDRGLVYLAIILPLAVAVSLLRFYQLGWHPIYLLHLAALVVIELAAIFRKRLSHQLRGVLVLGPFLVVGIVGLRTFGVVGAGPLLLVFFAFLTGLFFGLRAGLIACLLDLVVVLTIGTLVLLGRLHFSMDLGAYAMSYAAWIIIIATFMLIVPVVVMALDTIYTHMETLLETQQLQQAKHKRLIDNLVNTVLFRREPDGSLSYISPSVTGILGYAVEDFSADLDHLLTDHPLNLNVPHYLEQCAAGERPPSYEVQVRHKDGGTRWLSITEVPVCDEQGNVTATEGVAHDVTARKTREELTAIQLELSESASQKTVDQLLQLLLDRAEELTASQVSFYHFIEQDQNIVQPQTWSTNTLQNMCTADQQKLHFPIDQAGVWVDCIHEGGPVVHNDYASLPHRKGMPEGHAPIVRELLVPVVRANRITAILGVGNKETDYVQQDVSTVSELANIAWDIVCRKRAEMAQQNSEARFRTLVEHAGDAFYLVDPVTTRILEVNRQACQDLQFSHDQLLRFTIHDIDANDDNELIRTTLGQLEHNHKLTIETEHKRRDGTVFPVEIRLSPIQLNGKQRVIALARDISERKQAEEERQRFELVIKQAAEIVVITDTQGNIIYVNPAFEKTTGYSLAEAVGRNPRILKSGKMDPAEYRVLWETILSGHTWTGQLTNKKKDGSLYVEDALISPLRNEAGEIVNFVAVKRDITNELELKEQFFQSQKMEAIGQLAGGVAHDFNNLLQVILGYGELALEESRGRKVVNELREVMKASENAKTLVRQLLAFSRKQVLDTIDLNLGDVVNDLAKMIQRVIGENISFNIMSESGLKLIHADRGQLEQILLNLCVNARDAMPDGGTLTIETRNTELDEEFCLANPWARPGRYVVLSVTDTGCGMDEETQRHIFEPFFTTKKLGKGTGLGLSTVFGIIRQHNGMIHVYSEPGHGTTFRIYLPMIDAQQIIERQHETTAPHGGFETILLADDDATVRRVAIAMLQRAGYAVIEAGDGEEAIRILNERIAEIDLALLDMVMPKIGGRHVFDHMRSNGMHIPVLFASGYSTDAFHGDFKVDQNVGLIQKPYLRDALLHKVREILDRRRLQQAADDTQH